jgi:hypothetical protein
MCEIKITTKIIASVGRLNYYIYKYPPPSEFTEAVLIIIIIIIIHIIIIFMHKVISQFNVLDSCHLCASLVYVSYSTC